MEQSAHAGGELSLLVRSGCLARAHRGFRNPSESSILGIGGDQSAPIAQTQKRR